MAANGSANEESDRESGREFDQEFDQEMEGVLRDHFASEASDLVHPGDPWQQLEGRMEEKPTRRLPGLWLLTGTGQRRWAPALAAAVVTVVAVVAVAGIWTFVGDGDGEPGSMASGQDATAAPPAAASRPAGLPAATGVPKAQETPAPLAAAVESGRDQADSPGREEAPAAALQPAATPIAAPAPTEAPAAEPRATAMPMPTGAPQPAPTQAPWAAAATPAAAAAESAPAATMAPRGDGYLPPTAQPQPNRPGATTFRDYGRLPFVPTAEDAVSTFSLDTDRTSFQLALNWARSGYEVAPDSVRAEEWVNSFDYGYRPPSDEWGFAITSDVVQHPLNGEKHLARIAFQAAEISDHTPLNVTLVLDASGSMASGNRVAIARQAAETIRQSLRSPDRIAVVHFTDYVLNHLTVEHLDPDDRSVEDSIRALQPHGSTNVQAGLDLGVRLADEARRRRPDAYNYVILMSDGVANVDATDPFAILETARDPDDRPDGRNPLRLITIGVGVENYNDYLLEQLAQYGNGWYRYLDTTDQARMTFSRENWLALSNPYADQTRAQVTWDPDLVRSWRIVGYENRVTADETFVQDRKEFAEIPSGAATTVFYELELHPKALRRGGEVDLGDVELRWVVPGSGQSRGQRAEVSGRPSDRFRTGASLLQFGAIVALSADRYSGLQHAGGDYYPDIHSELVSLSGMLESLQGSMGQLTAYQDFQFVLGEIAGAARGQAPPPTPSGYSR